MHPHWNGSKPLRHKFVLQVIFIPRSRLNKLVEQSQLPVDLGGSFVYNHDLWMENRMVSQVMCLTRVRDVLLHIEK